jgi:hypothetical protein
MGATSSDEAGAEGSSKMDTISEGKPYTEWMINKNRAVRMASSPCILATRHCPPLPSFSFECALADGCPSGPEAANETLQARVQLDQ